MRGEVTATVAATQAIALQGASGGAQPYRTAQVALERASEAARATTKDFMHEFYDEHEFDKYLEFTSTEDRDDYRRREEEYRRAIQKALDEHTPEGDLKALDLSIEQMKDAGAHGADKSPEYQTTLDGLNSARKNLAVRIAPAKQVSEASERSAPTSTDTTPAPVPASVMDQIKAAKIAIADQTQEGHGVTGKGAPSRSKISL